MSALMASATAAKASPKRQHLAATVGEDEFQLGRRQPCIERHRNGADFRRTVEQAAEFDAMGISNATRSPLPTPSEVSTLAHLLTSAFICV